MPLINPGTVIHPQDRVANVNVIWNGGAWKDGDPWSGWSVCRLIWDGGPAVGIRWNGSAGEPGVGYPARAKYPTWTILPQPAGEAIAASAAEHAAGEKGAAAA
jgi:hypothetical protein